jgi:UDP-N-acetylglucosamine acyltransferase
MIHPTAVVHRAACLDPTVDVGPFAVIEADVTLGPHCAVGPHVCLLGRCAIGAHNRFHAGCVIGDAPQDLKYQGTPTGLRIGDNNVFREHVTVHRSSRPEDDTVIGSGGYFMANCHVGHNSRLGDHVIMANGVLLGGYVEIGSRAFLSGNCLVHQFVRIGELALMQGGAAISKDLPPCTIARGDNQMCGLNVVGLRRAGFTAPQRLELKRLYHRLFRSRDRLQTALERARAEFTDPICLAFLDFVAASRRGICAEVSTRKQAEDAAD